MPSCLLLEATAPDDRHGIPLLITKRASSWGLRETIIDKIFPVGYVAYSPNGKLIVTICLRSVVEVWDLATGTALYKWLKSDPKDFHSAAFSPNGQCIAFTQGSTLQVWDMVTGSQRCIMKGHSDTATCIAFSPNSTVIASGSQDRTLRIWDAATGAGRLVTTGHTKSVNALAFAPDGQTVVSASSDGTLRVWDVLSGTELRVIDADSGQLYCVAFSPDGATIALGGSYRTIQLWSATSYSRQHALGRHSDGVQTFAFSPDGKSIVSCDIDGLARIWDATTGIEERSLRDDVLCVAYSPDGKSVAMGLKDGTARIWDANAHATTHSSTDGHQGEISSISFSPDGMLIASSSDDRTVRVWNAITGAERHVMEVEDAVTSVALSPDSKSIVFYSGNDDTVQVRDVVTGDVQHILTHPVSDSDTAYSFGPLRRTIFSTDGKAIILREEYGERVDDGPMVVTGSWDLTTTSQPQYAEWTSSHKPARAIDDLHALEQRDICLPRYLRGIMSPWIKLDNGQEEPKDICWLPKERRGRMAYSGTKVCIGGQDGAITILDFSAAGLLQ
jgi:WD40 repeat protein